MGTPMALSYANLFMGNYKQNLFSDYFQRSRLSLLVWFCFIDDIFFICTGNKGSLDHVTCFTKNHTKSKNMKSKIKLKIYLSSNEVHFADVTVSLKYRKLRTLFAKRTDSHFYLNISSCNPSHILKNIPKGQFIRLQRICF